MAFNANRIDGFSNILDRMDKADGLAARNVYPILLYLRVMGEVP
jgi:hypothetical protein